MKRGGSSQKGNAFENWGAKTLSLWITGGKDKTQLIPARLSGGWQGRHESNEPWRHSGDLAPNGAVGDTFRRLFSVELKHRQTIDLYHVWTRAPHKQNLLGWWKQCWTDVEESSGHGVYLQPMLVARANNKPTLVGLSKAFVDDTPPLHQLTQVLVIEWEDLALVPLEELMGVPPWWK